MKMTLWCHLTVSVGEVLMREQSGVEKPIIFISHILPDQETRWGIMKLELYSFVFYVKQLTPYLMVNYLQ